eukprot:COSAG01_NODE_3698_length_5784_cov_5.069129_5_plen_64_part_00
MGGGACTSQPTATQSRVVSSSPMDGRSVKPGGGGGCSHDSAEMTPRSRLPRGLSLQRRVLNIS